MKKLITFFLNEKCVEKQKNNPITNELLTLFYNDISEIKNFPIHSIINNELIFPKIVTLDSVPEEMKNMFHKLQIHHEYSFVINKKKYVIHFFSQNQFDTQLVKYMYIWFHIIEKYANKKCSEILTIYIYLTDIDRNLPKYKKIPLSQLHVNGGYTYVCQKENEIVIHRKQEWFKVFIHETFHAFGLDFANMNMNVVKSEISILFPIASDMLLFESYTEVWAEIINVIFLSYMKTINKLQYLHTCEFLLNFERFFAIFQMVKVLNHYELEYIDLFEKTSSTSFSEKTNVFAYYIIRAIFMFHYQDFLAWCKVNNANVFQAQLNERFLILFCDFIKDKYQSKKIYHTIQCAKGVLKNTDLFTKNTMRMSISGMD